MEKKIIDYNGVLCPFCVVKIIRDVDSMKPGEHKTFMVDDPLAIKSVPEELEEDKNVSVAIERSKKHWNIQIVKT